MYRSLAAGGAKIVLEVQPELRTLMKRLDGAATVIARRRNAAAFDVHCPLGSLPLAFKTEPETVPAQMPYLRPTTPILRNGRRGSPRCRGRGSRSHGPAMPVTTTIATARSPFARLAPLFVLPRRTLASSASSATLRAEDAVGLAADSRVTHVGDELEDFGDTAAVVALCDLVIAVDTAVAHLAGAMGRPVWVMLPFAPDWRWTLHGDTTPWYPTARLVPADLARRLGQRHRARWRSARSLHR